MYFKRTRCKNCQSSHDEMLEYCPRCGIKNEEHLLFRRTHPMTFVPWYRELMLFLCGFIGLTLFSLIYTIIFKATYEADKDLGNMLINTASYLTIFVLLLVIMFPYFRSLINKFKIPLAYMWAGIGTGVLLGLSMALILNKSMDTIKVVMNTAYPGARFETGGGQLDYLFSYASNIFLSFRSRNLIGNSCEQALMFTLFPIGLILAIRGLIINKKKDKLLICLLVAYVFLGIWCTVGFPKILAKVTLMYNSQSHRALLALGFAEVLILIRSLATIKESISRIPSIILTILLTAIIVIKNIMFHGDYLTIKMDIVLAIACLYLFYTALRYNNKICKNLFCIGMIGTMFICGAMVNPLRFGATIFTKSEVLENVKKIDKEDSGIWITEGEMYPITNYIAIAGVKTINVTNTYPDLDKWHKLDSEKEYEEIYNRYAHIIVNLSDEEKEEKFELPNPDVFAVNMNLDDLDTLNIKYIFTRSDLERYNNDRYEFKDVYDYNDFKVYKIIRQE